MNRYVERRALLARMIAARDATAAQLATIERAVRVEAEARARADSRRERQFGRHSSTWGAPDERRYRAELRELWFRRVHEIGALTRRLVRQEEALARFRSKYGFNEPAGTGRFYDVGEK